MIEIQIREATPSDAAALAALNDHVHGLHVVAEPYDFRPTEPSEVRAFKNETHVLHMNHIAVDPAFRRRGVGRALYAAAETEARRRGIDRLAMDHWTFNSDAAAFFGSLGFEGFNVRMRKRLEA